MLLIAMVTEPNRDGKEQEPIEMKTGTNRDAGTALLLELGGGQH